MSYTYLKNKFIKNAIIVDFRNCFKLFMESSPHPSKISIFLKSNSKISEGSPN